jgi:hypothetical protein
MPLKALWRIIRVGYLAIYGALLFGLLLVLSAAILHTGSVTLDTNLGILLLSAGVAPLVVGTAVENVRSLPRRQATGRRRAVGTALATLLVLVSGAFVLSALAASYQWVTIRPQDQTVLVGVWVISAPLLAVSLVRLVRINIGDVRRGKDDDAGKAAA